jgi:hypothetical protein
VMWMRCDLGPGDRLAGIGDPGSAESGYRSRACAIKRVCFPDVTSHQPELLEGGAGRKLPCLLNTLDNLYQITGLRSLGSACLGHDSFHTLGAQMDFVNRPQEICELCSPLTPEGKYRLISLHSGIQMK